MPDSSTAAYPYLEEALPGFHRGRVLVKAAGDSLAGLGFIGTKFDFYRFANRLRLAACFGGLTSISDLKFEISDPAETCIRHIFAHGHLTTNPWEDLRFEI